MSAPPEDSQLTGHKTVSKQSLGVNMSKVLVTGFTGCIGSATVAYLFERGVKEVIGFSRAAELSRIDPAIRDRITIVQGDISRESDVRDVIRAHQPTHIIHLAAFQSPDCQAQPFRGMEINVHGTARVFRAAAEIGSVERVVFASSAAVYGPRTLYSGSTVPTDGAYQPPNLYGYWKVAGEGMAQAFFQETGITTVSLRLLTTYGPGRDQGLTSAPTTAIKAVSLGVPFDIPYNGREHYHYVKDVASGFGEAALAPFAGYGVFNLRGQTIPVEEFLARLRTVADEQGLGSGFQIKISADAADFPFVCDLDDSETVKTFPAMTLTPLEVGLQESLHHFRGMVERGELTADELPR